MSRRYTPRIEPRNLSRDWRKPKYPVLTIATIVWCVIVFFSVSGQGVTVGQAARFGLFDDYDVFSGAYWGLVTSAFVHVEPIHLLFNLYWLWFIGGALERSIGPLRWIVFCAFAAFVSSGIQLLSGESGIGFSGVGYALFGFGWVARSRYPELARIVTDRTALIFIGWGIFCVVATQIGMMHIGNWAHASGLAFGVATAALTLDGQSRWLGAIGLAVLAAAAVVPVAWNPRSQAWVNVQAVKAHSRGDLATAARWYRQSLSLGGDATWAWSALAAIYGYQRDTARYREALDNLRALDPEEAKDVERTFGSPGVWSLESGVRSKG